MKIKKKCFKYLVYISLLFLIYYIIKNDYLQIPKIDSLFSLFISIIFLLVTFILQAINWHQILKSELPISVKDAISSVGLSIFTKYIPGKVMVILGKVAFINNKYQYSSKNLISISMYDQIIVLWLGLIFGSIPFFSIKSFKVYIIYYLFLLFVFTLFIFTRLFHNIIERLSKMFLKKEIKIPRLKFKETVKALPSFVLFWIILSVGFYFFVNSLTADPVSIWSGFSFALAATFGIIALVAPGGIGAREGILIVLLTSYGLDVKTATTISIASRLWFLIGELFIFVLGFTLDRNNKKGK